MISKVRTFWENEPNKSCRGHEGLSFGDLELDLEGHLKVNFEFYNFYSGHFPRKCVFFWRSSHSFRISCV